MEILFNILVYYSIKPKEGKNWRKCYNAIYRKQHKWDFTYFSSIIDPLNLRGGSTDPVRVKQEPRDRDFSSCLMANKPQPAMSQPSPLQPAPSQPPPLQPVQQMPPYPQPSVSFYEHNAVYILQV